MPSGHSGRAAADNIRTQADVAGCFRFPDHGCTPDWAQRKSLGETAACGVLLPLGWEQRVESPRTIPHQVLPRSRFAGKRVHGFDAYFPHLRRKRLQPFPQTFATALANVCIPGRKRLRLKPFWRGMNVHQRTAEESLVSTLCFLLLASGDLHRLSADPSCPVRIDVCKAKRSKRLR